MGLRLHKQLGYGLVLNSSNSESVTWDTSKSYLEGEQFQAWLRTCNLTEKDEDSLWMELSVTPKWTVYDLVKHVDLDEDSSVILFTPPGYEKEWSHSDDMIDYIEDEWDQRKSEVYQTPTTMRVLPIAPFPYEGSYMNAKTGEVLPARRQEDYRFMRRFHQNGNTEAALRCAQSLGHETVEEALKFTAPYIPENVQKLTEWLGVFPEKKTMYQLRPMLLKWWV